MSALDVLFPTVRAAVLGRLFKSPRRPRHIRDLARQCELRLSTVQQELHNLAALGVLKRTSTGKYVFYVANPAHPFSHSLTRLVGASERLPLINRSAMYRANRRRQKLRKRDPFPMKPYDPMNWGLLKKH